MELVDTSLAGHCIEFVNESSSTFMGNAVGGGGKLYPEADQT